MFTASFLFLTVIVAEEWINAVLSHNSNAAVISIYKMHSLWITDSFYLEREKCYINKKNFWCNILLLLYTTFTP